MYNFTREDIDLEAIRTRIARMSDSELLKYGQSAAWMAEHNDRTTWRVQLEEARAEWRRRQAAAPRKQVSLPHVSTKNRWPSRLTVSMVGQDGQPYEVAVRSLEPGNDRRERSPGKRRKEKRFPGGEAET
jgi:hypothetical protein